MRQLNYPLPRTTWYQRQVRSGVIVRVRLRNGRQVGSYENQEQGIAGHGVEV